jgi:hypothetical protein
VGLSSVCLGGKGQGEAGARPACGAFRMYVELCVPVGHQALSASSFDPWRLHLASGILQEKEMKD